MHETMPKPLFAEFLPATTEAWMAAVERDLKGASFEKRLVWHTDDGIPVRPFHRAEDLRDATPAPFLRCFPRTGSGWAIRDVVRDHDVASANAAARHALARGADQIQFRVYPSGVGLRTEEDMKALLQGIDPTVTPVFFAAGPLAPQVVALFLNEAATRGVPVARWRGGSDADPVLDGCLGWREGGVDSWEAEATPLVAFDAQSLPLMRTLAVRAVAFHEAGATATQELAYGLSVLVEYLAHLRRRNLTPGRVIRQAEIQFGVGANYFVEIAKLRAARVLIAKVLDAFGIEDVRPRVHADTSLVTKTLYDSHVNMLRSTTEAMAAAVAGVDSLTVWPFDELASEANEFSGHLARNVSLLLREESYFGRVSDPLGGSYTVEFLTAAVAEKAWALFQEVESAGGFVSAWQSGLVPSALAASRAAKQKATDGRRTPIVGTTVYPNMKESILDRLKAPEHAPTVALPAFAMGDSLALLREALAQGASLDNWLTSSSALDGALGAFRPAASFEAVRLRVERHVAAGRRKPRVRLVLAGDGRMRKARAMFCLSFFGAGGFDVAEDRPLRDVTAFTPDDSDWVVLCSSDGEYVDLAKALAPKMAATPLVIAGYPEEALEALKDLGVTRFVHIRQDAVATLSLYLDELGVVE